MAQLLGHGSLYTHVTRSSFDGHATHGRAIARICRYDRVKGL
jgi:hypothetical protein